MTNNDQNQQKEIINLHELQPELIEARLTLTKVLKTLCSNDQLMQKVYDYSGDSATTIIWYLQQVIKYLDAIITNNKVILDALSGKF
ncbi:hypothetical protein [Candidatus Tisiphia endosymbiont of Micropterix aruncella]|uniref:hypothetical protein n=1 Tax=Candidatus Tisiphia endosymbiont of Micropterix aruncella TaxID=3066271 RepID=UPI003AA8632E